MHFNLLPCLAHDCWGITSWRLYTFIRYRLYIEFLVFVMALTKNFEDKKREVLSLHPIYFIVFLPCIRTNYLTDGNPINKCHTNNRCKYNYKLNASIFLWLTIVTKSKIKKISWGLIEVVSALLRHVFSLADYMSFGSKLSVWCFLFNRLDIVGRGMFCAASCNSGFALFLIVMSNLVYAMSNVFPPQLCSNQC